MKKAFPLLVGWRVLAAALVVVQVVTLPGALWAVTAPVLNQDALHPAPVTTPLGIKANGMRPVDVPATGKLEFTKAVTDEEIRNCRLFEEPLVVVGGQPKSGENAALAAAILAFADRKSLEDFTPFTEFLAAYPKSPWRASLQLNLGIWYAKGCFYGRAFKALVEAWELTKDEAGLAGKTLGDRAVAELADAYASLGCADALAPLLEEIKGREVLGSARQKLVGAREMLIYMYYHPDHAYNCGPLALDGLRQVQKRTREHVDELIDPEENVIGRSLPQLVEQAGKAGMAMTAVKRPAGEPFPVPSLVHWKTRHYDALVERKGDRYLLRNPFVNHDIWVSQEALEEETTGYVVVATDEVPKGWVKVTETEAKTVWGGCHTGTANKDNTDTCQKASGGCCGAPMASYNIQFALVNLHITDTPISYVPPRGPAIEVKVNYNHREANQPQTFTYSNFGRLWTFNWLSYVTDTNSTSNDAAVSLYELGGGTKTFKYPSGNTSVSNSSDNSVLARTTSGTAVTGYTRTYKDGTQYIYNQPTSMVAGVSRKMFLKEIHDPAGNVVTLSYDQFRVTGITDAIGQVTTFSYDLPGDIYKVTKVTDFFGRFATFSYNGSGQLTSLTDPVGIVSQFTYQGDFIQKLTTPYGDTTFSGGESGSEATNRRWLDVTDPLGGRERVEYYQNDLADVPEHDPSFATGAQTINGLNIQNELTNTRETFYWDKKAMMEAPGDYTRAHIYHWLHDVATDQITDVLESEKPPLESRIYYNYPGQTVPYYQMGSSANVTRSGRFVDGAGTLQINQYEYNAQGNRTKTIDPLGRTTTYSYETSGIDLLEVRNTTGGLSELLASFTYTDGTHPTSIHKPLTMTDAAGQVTTMTYNGQGQLLARTVMRNGQNETTTWVYDGNGYLQSITGPVAGATVSFTYDGFGRVRTMADPEGYMLTYDYDAINRLTKLTYPDSTYEQISYNKLDPEWQRDRQGRWTHLFHDELRRVARVDDPAGRSTIYDWCVCGALHGLKDGEGRMTHWEYDIQKRVTKKTYADDAAVKYAYDPYRGLKTERVDAKDQRTNYAYNLDNTLQQTSYTNTAGQALNPPTPSVSFTYDANHLRVASMTDGTGTTNYSYKTIAAGTLGAGRLASVDGPLGNDVITYGYDELGRTTSRAIDGVAETTTFDVLGRITGVGNPLGSFVYSYLNQTNHLSGVAYPNGQTSSYSYYPNTSPAGTGNGDQRLQTIWHKLTIGSATTTISKFDYVYSPAGEITNWTQQADASPAVGYDFGYDGASQLLSATQKDAAGGTVQKQYTYGYDKSGNRTTEQIDASITTAAHNNLNQLTARSGAGPMVFEGTVNEPSTVTVGGNPATVDGNNRFRGTAVVSPGLQSVKIKATDASGNITTRYAQVTVTAGTVGQSLTYDSNGNMTGDGMRTFGWDAENRLVKVTIGSEVQEFVYNGVGQRVAEKQSGSVIKQWVWDGFKMREERDASNAVTKRFYGQGIVVGATLPAAATDKLYYTRDHLGSIREVLDATGAPRVRYNYDAWGRPTKVSGDIDADFGYTGHYWNAFGYLWMTYYRSYDAELGRWLSRDPIEENGGINLYGYVLNGPTGSIDPLGLQSPANSPVGQIQLGAAMRAADAALAGAGSTGLLLMQASALLNQAGSLEKKKDEADDLIEHMDEHIGKVNAVCPSGDPDPGDPEQDPVKGWIKEVKASLKNLHQTLKRMPKNQSKRDPVESAIQRGQQQLQNWGH